MPIADDLFEALTPLRALTGPRPDSPSVVVYPHPRDRVTVHARYAERWGNLDLTRADARDLARFILALLGDA